MQRLVEAELKPLFDRLALLTEAFSNSCKAVDAEPTPSNQTTLRREGGAVMRLIWEIHLGWPDVVDRVCNAFRVVISTVDTGM